MHSVATCISIETMFELWWTAVSITFMLILNEGLNRFGNVDSEQAT